MSCSIQVPKASRPNEGMLFINVEMSPMAAEYFEAGRLGKFGIEVNRLVERCIKGFNSSLFKKNVHIFICFRCFRFSLCRLREFVHPGRGAGVGSARRCAHFEPRRQSGRCRHPGYTRSSLPLSPSRRQPRGPRGDGPLSPRSRSRTANHPPSPANTNVCSL